MSVQLISVVVSLHNLMRVIDSKEVNQTCLKEVLPKIVDCANITGAISISDPLSINITDLMQRSFCV